MFFSEASFQGKEVDVHVDGELLCVGGGSGVLTPLCFGRRIFKVLTTGMLWFFRGQKGVKVFH